MRKLFLITLCLVTIAVQAQQIHFTPKAGVNIANMTDADNADPRIGLNAGVAAEFSFMPQFSLEPGIFYSMQGIKTTFEGVTTTLKNDYINVPVLAKYYVYEGFNVFAGPQVGFLVSSKTSGKEGGVSASVDTKEFFNTIDVSAVVGIGYQTALGLNFSANYNLGLLNAIKDAEDNETSNNSVIQVSVGWRF